jgi:hypothetical protein
MNAHERRVEIAVADNKGWCWLPGAIIAVDQDGRATVRLDDGRVMRHVAPISMRADVTPVVACQV